MRPQQGCINPKQYIVNIDLENENKKKIDDKKKLISQKPIIIDKNTMKMN